MNSVKVTYLICNLIMELALLALAVAAPICITPDYYWWTAFAILSLVLNSSVLTDRLNTWGGMGKA